MGPPVYILIERHTHDVSMAHLVVVLEWHRGRSLPWLPDDGTGDHVHRPINAPVDTKDLPYGILLSSRSALWVRGGLPHADRGDTSHQLVASSSVQAGRHGAERRSSVLRLRPLPHESRADGQSRLRGLVDTYA